MSDYSFKFLYLKSPTNKCNKLLDYDPRKDGKEKFYKDTGLTIKSKKDRFVFINKKGEKFAAIKKILLTTPGKERVFLRDNGRVNIFWQSKDENGNIVYVDNTPFKGSFEKYRADHCKANKDPLDILPHTKAALARLKRYNSAIADLITDKVKKAIKQRGERLKQHDELIAEIIVDLIPRDPLDDVPHIKHALADLAKYAPDVANLLEGKIVKAIKLKGKVIKDNEELIADLIRDLIPKKDVAKLEKAIAEAKKSTSYMKAVKNTGSKLIYRPHSIKYKGAKAYAVTLKMPEGDKLDLFLSHFLNASQNEAARRRGNNLLIVYLPYDKGQYKYKSILNSINIISDKIVDARKIALTIVSPQSDQIIDGNTITFAIVPEKLGEMVADREKWLHYVIAKKEELTKTADITEFARTSPQNFTGIVKLVQKIEGLIDSYEIPQLNQAKGELATLAADLRKMDKDKEADPYFVDLYKAYHLHLKTRLPKARRISKLEGKEKKIAIEKARKETVGKTDVGKTKASAWQGITSEYNDIKESKNYETMTDIFADAYEKLGAASAVHKQAAALLQKIDGFVRRYKISTGPGSEYTTLKQDLEELINDAKRKIDIANEALERKQQDKSPESRIKRLKGEEIPNEYRVRLKAYEGDKSRYGKQYSFIGVPDVNYENSFRMIKSVFGNDVDGMVINVKTNRESFKGYKAQILKHAITKNIKIIHIDTDLFKNRKIESGDDIHIFTGGSKTLCANFHRKEAAHWAGIQKKMKKEIEEAARRKKQLEKAYKLSTKVLANVRNFKGVQGTVKRLALDERNKYFVFKCPAKKASQFAGIIKRARAGAVKIVYKTDANKNNDAMKKLASLLKGKNGMDVASKTFEYKRDKGGVYDLLPEMPFNTYYVVVIPAGAMIKISDVWTILKLNGNAKLKSAVSSLTPAGPSSQKTKAPKEIKFSIPRQIVKDVKFLNEAVIKFGSEFLTSRQSHIVKAFIDSAKAVKIDVGGVYGRGTKRVNIPGLYDEYKKLTDLSKITSTKDLQAHFNKLDKISDGALSELKNKFGRRLKALGVSVADTRQLLHWSEQAFRFPRLCTEFKNSDPVKKKARELVNTNR